jgi:6,7-dimethyl-8-ribityllumazine synthase
MPTVIEGMLNASKRTFAIVATRFNELITKKLVDGAIDCLTRHNATPDAITVVWVPGAFEVPLAAQRIARSKKYDAIICVGAVIRGDTPHFDYVASEVSKGIARVSLGDDTPVLFGILTTDTIEQAVERAGTKAGNKGWDAALAAIEITDLFSRL